jgi:GYF domain 2
VIRFTCPRCKTILSRNDHEAGLKMSCSGCAQRVQIPQPPPRTDQTLLGELGGPAAAYGKPSVATAPEWLADVRRAEQAPPAVSAVLPPPAIGSQQSHLPSVPIPSPSPVPVPLVPPLPLSSPVDPGQTTSWFVARDGHNLGPVSLAQLKQLAISGQIRAADLVWQEGMGNWAPASAIPALMDRPFDAQNILSAIAILATDPVGGLPSAFQRLNKKEAVTLGVVFAFLFDLCVLFFARLGPIDLFHDLRWVRTNLSVRDLGTIALLGIVPLASIAGGCLLTRKVFRGVGSIATDMFLAGTSLVPISLWVVLASVLGFANLEVIFGLLTFAVCITVIFLYVGFQRVNRVPETASAIAVPLVLLLSVWIAKVLATTLIF